MTLRLHYSPGACSLAAHIVLANTGAPFEAHRVTIAEGAHRRPEFLKLNPRGRVPVLESDDGVVTESMAVLSYLGHRFPESGLLPLNDLKKLARCEELLAFYVSSVHIAFAQVWRTERFTVDVSLHSAVKDEGRHAVLRYFADIEALAARSDWFVGDKFTVADTYPLIFYRWGQRIGLDLSAFPHWTQHAQRVLLLPAVVRAIAAEGLSAGDFVPRVTGTRRSG